MGAAHFTELVAWQLANRLKLAVYDLTARPAVARDFKYCDQIRDSASSVPSNVAEGFARYSHRDFARFVVIAKGSLMETQNHLIDGVARRHMNDGEFRTLWQLSEQTLGAVTGLLTYLQRTDRPLPRKRLVRART